MHDAAGPLRPSQSLLEALRLVRAISGKQVGVAAPTLDVGAIHAIEAELGATLPDDVLIVFAAKDEILTRATGLRIDGVLDAAERRAERADDEHVAIAWLEQDPFAAHFEGAHGGATRTITVAKEGALVKPNTIFVDSFASTVGELAKENIFAWYRREDSWLATLQKVPALPLEDATFAPALVGELPKPKVEAPRFVAHPKFGRGRVVETKTEGGETKLVIDFESAGRKTLLERFVSSA